MRELIERELETFADDRAAAGSDVVSLVARSLYRMLLSRWVGPFAEVLVLSTETLRADPRSTMRSVENWLGLEPIEYELGYELNTGGASSERQLKAQALPTQVAEQLHDERRYWQEALGDGPRCGPQPTPRAARHQSVRSSGLGLQVMSCEISAVNEA